MTDLVNNPPHYQQNASGIEVIELTENLSFCAGNALKYIARHPYKGKPVEDVKKAIYYVKRELTRVTKDKDTVRHIEPDSALDLILAWVNAEDNVLVKNIVFLLYCTQFDGAHSDLKAALTECEYLLEQVESEYGE